MKITLILIGAVLAAGAPEMIGFDKEDVGKPPSGWTATQTGTGQATWAIVRDDSAPSKPNVLKAIRSGHVPRVPERRHAPERWLR